MAEIHVLPARPRGSDQSDRLRADLVAAHARGVDLGSRVPHIHAGGERLLQLSRALERAIEDVDLSLNELGFQDAATLEALRSFVSAAGGSPIRRSSFRPLSDRRRQSKLDAAPAASSHGGRLGQAVADL
ncbi:hypothetical protein [Methylobacterium sp. A52T]